MHFAVLHHPCLWKSRHTITANHTDPPLTLNGGGGGGGLNQQLVHVLCPSLGRSLSHASFCVFRADTQTGIRSFCLYSVYVCIHINIKRASLFLYEHKLLVSMGGCYIRKIYFFSEYFNFVLTSTIFVFL